MSFFASSLSRGSFFDLDKVFAEVDASNQRFVGYTRAQRRVFRERVSPRSLCNGVWLKKARLLARGIGVLFLVLAVVPPEAASAATQGITVNTTNMLSAPYLPAARSPTQVENSPAWKDSATVLGTTTFTENLETLTPGAAVTLNWLTARTKIITLNQNTTFSFANSPTSSTNLQRMVVEVVGDAVSTVSFAGVTWQTAQVTTPAVGTVTVYLFEASNSAINGYADGASSGQQVFSGFYGGGLPTDTPTTSAALAFDLDPPNTLYMWDGALWW